MGCFVSKEDRGRIGVIEEYGCDDKDGGKVRNIRAKILRSIGSV